MRSTRATEVNAPSTAARFPPRKPLAATMHVLFGLSSLPCPRVTDGRGPPTMRFAPTLPEIYAPSQIFLATEQGFDATPEPSGSDRAFRTFCMGPKSVDAASKTCAPAPLEARPPRF